jgi:hypothetical protein
MSDLLAQTRLGLHVTREELHIWRQRAAAGPYKNRSDVSENSPDDWSRIHSNAMAFKAAPAAFRWAGPTLRESSGRVKKGAGDDVRLQNEPNGRALAHQIRDAAFLVLVDDKRADRQALKQAVKAELLHATSIPSLDFNNRTLWPKTYFRDINPLFQTMNWFNNYLYAYDYIDIADQLQGENTFSAQERKRIEQWLLAAAEFACQEQDWDVDRNFTNRSSSSADAAYTPAHKQAAAQRGGANLVTHYTASGPGHTIYPLMQTFNNRRMACYRYGALVGIKLGENHLVESAKRYVKDWIKYSVFPDGTMGEMERWSGSIPDLGWAYCTDVIASAVTIADALARRGDHSLYDYKTSIGLYGTEGSRGESKNLYKTLQMMSRIAAKQVTWYGTNNRANLSHHYLIDGETSNWKALHDVWLTMANLKYKDKAIQAMYMRKGQGLTPYWSRPVGQGKHPVWTGDWGIFPGVLFMFGQMEDKVNPYPGSYTPIVEKPEPEEEETTPDKPETDPEPVATNPETNDGTGSIVREYWNNIMGYHISNIPLESAPSGTEVLTRLASPVDIGDNYGTRIRGYIHPPVSGEYTFWLAGDNMSELWLSTDEAPDNKELIANIERWTTSREWTKFDSQQSEKIVLKAGKKYYIEVLHKEMGGGDHVAVGWKLPDGTLERPIPGIRLSPYANPTARLDTGELTPELVVQAYPNPFRELVHVNIGRQTGTATILLVDAMGKITYRHSANLSGDKVKLTLDLSSKNLAPGIYFLRIETTDGKKKIIKLIKS